MSINGWFHGNIKKTYETPIYIPPTKGLFSDINLSPVSTDINIEEWISFSYLGADTIGQIQGEIEERSEISLQNYFKEEKYNELIIVLNDTGNRFKFS